MTLIGPLVFGARVFLLNRAAGIRIGDGAKSISMRRMNAHAAAPRL